MDRITEQFFLAAGRGDSETVMQLFLDGADINATDEAGCTAIMAATYGNHVETVAELVQAGADINLRDNKLNNPMLYAGAEGLLDILKIAISARADTSLTNRYGGTALIPACERGHLDIARELITRTDVDINHVNNLGWTALLEAIILSDGGIQHQRIVKLLLDYGADIHIPDKDGVSPQQHAKQKGFEKIDQMLVFAGSVQAPVPEEQLGRLLLSAAERSDIAAIRLLLQRGAPLDFQDYRGRTALIVAAYKNDIYLANLLIRAGADVNIRDNTKQSAYLIATSDGHLEILRLALKAGADVNGLDSYNGTGLIRASDRGHVEIVRELLKTAIPINHINRLGWTALLEAIHYGDGSGPYVKIVKMLIEAGADVNLADSNGDTPLTYARSRGQSLIAELLRQAGGK